MACLDEDTIADLLAGRVRADAPGVGDHLQACPFCARLIGLAADDFPAEAPPVHADAATVVGQKIDPERPGAPAVTHVSPPTVVASAGSLPPGTRLNDTYEVVRLVGYGGMGEVYEVRNVRLAGRYAVKVLRAEISNDQELLVRFRREADITSALAHPNIVQVIDFNQAQDGRWFLAMELLEGGDLSELLRREPKLPLAHALRIIAQIASALTAAHRQGIVHRDLKPGNVFVLPEDDEGGTRIKLLDFGLSKRNTDLVGSLVHSHDNALLGTPLYMAPEQARGENKKASPATDQYALAVLLFEMLAGAPPFQGRNLTDVLHAIAYQPPASLEEYRPELPVELGRAIARALSKAQIDRFGSVNEFMQAVERAVELAPPRLAPPTGDVTMDGRRRLLVAGAAVAGAAAISLATLGWVALRSAPAPASARPLAVVGTADVAPPQSLGAEPSPPAATGGGALPRGIEASPTLSASAPQALPKSTADRASGQLAAPLAKQLRPRLRPPAAVHRADLPGAGAEQSLRSPAGPSPGAPPSDGGSAPRKAVIGPPDLEDTL